ncbi:MAG: response regulator, partial [Myxococcales bacterium]
WIAAGTRFDLILCDMMMPLMTGMEFHMRLVTLAPEQADRIVFMTGGAFTPRAREFLARLPNLRLEKPFDLAHVLAMVAAHLEVASRPGTLSLDGDASRTAQS